MSKWASVLHAQATSYGMRPCEVLPQCIGTDADKSRFDLAVMVYARAAEAWAQHEQIQAQK